MKAIRKIGMWKAIAFLAAAISLFSCCPDEDDLNKASIKIESIENVTNVSATFVATVTPNLNTTVSFFYSTGNDSWKEVAVEGIFDGIQPVKVTADVSDLKPNTSYKVKAVAVNGSGTSSAISTFTTAAFPKPVVVIDPAENVKISTAKLTASVVPGQDNTSVSFEYQTTNSSWKSQTLPSKFSGQDSVKVTFDLSDLQANTLYNFIVKAANESGETCDTISFMTYAVSDYDGNLYHTVTIGTQTWLKENFKGTHFANGDPIPNVTDQTAWDKLITPGYCYYNNDPKYAKVYGALYNFYAFNDSRGLITGFHSPSKAEWTTLADYLDGNKIAGGKMKEAGYEHWIEPNAGATNESGFTALPSGARQVTFGHLGDAIVFWSTTKFMEMSNVVFTPSLGQTSSTLLLIGGSEFNQGFSIRLLAN